MDNFEIELQKNNRLLRALLTLHMEDYGSKEGAERQELVLARAGLGYQDIAEILNKKPDAVRMFLKRNQKSI